MSIKYYTVMYKDNLLAILSQDKISIGDEALDSSLINRVTFKRINNLVGIYKQLPIIKAENFNTFLLNNDITLY